MFKTNLSLRKSIAFITILALVLSLFAVNVSASSIDITIPFVTPVGVSGYVVINPTNINNSYVQILTPFPSKIDKNNTSAEVIKTPVLKVKLGINYSDRTVYYQTATPKVKISWKGVSISWNWSSRKTILRL